MKANGSDANGKAPVKAPPSIFDLLQKMGPQIEKALPKHLSSDRLARIAMTAIRQNPKLGNCTVQSLLGSVMQAAQLGLEPNTPLGLAWLIPRNNWNPARREKVPEAIFQMGYQGVLELAYRTKMYRTIEAREVYANDQFSFAYGIDAYLKHVPADDPQGDPVKYYAFYETVDGGRRFEVWSTQRILKHAARYSESFEKENSAWSDPDARIGMCKKTMLLQVLKYAPKSAELAQAMGVDNQVSRVNPEDPDFSIQTEFTVVSDENESATTAPTSTTEKPTSTARTTETRRDAESGPDSVETEAEAEPVELEMF